MEEKTGRCLVKDLDLTLQPHVAPRYKTRLPLATHQLRLRSLDRIVGHNLEADNKPECCWFYYTLHRSSMSSPFYTSELVDNANPRWAGLEVPTLHATGLSAASEIVLRLWRRTGSKDPSSDVTLFTWGISFTGLTYVGPKLPSDPTNFLRDNSLIFNMHGGCFVPFFCLVDKPDFKRYLYMRIPTSEIRESYTVIKLTSLRTKMQALKQQTEAVQALRDRIASGDDFQSFNKYKQTSLNRLLQPKKISREKKAELLRIRKELEVAKFRTKLLEQERLRKMKQLRTLNQLHITVMEENEDHGSDLMTRYEELNKDIERLRDWHQSHSDSREGYVQTTLKLAYRRRQLISELCLIYPISEETDRKFVINNVHLPDSEELESSNDTRVAVALGFVAHTTQMIANFLNVPTRYPILHCGSRSRVVDHIKDNLPDNERQFPLFSRSKDKLQFNYAVYLLNKNIAQLRWYCGLTTADLRATLPNLASLIINIKPNQPLDSSKRTFSGSSIDTDTGNVKHTIPLTPPLQKVMFEKCSRSSRSMSQSKIVKSGLGSSLDQGLDRPPQQSLILSDRSKRICKSEESAMDEKHFSLPRDDETNVEDDDVVFNVEITNSRNDENFATTIIDIDRQIEILIPISVSKPKNDVENFEDSNNIKQRSSNSISSCEMALSGSQNDMGEISNDNVDGVQSTNDECACSIGNYDIDTRKFQISSMGRKNDCKSSSSNESTIRHCQNRDVDENRDALGGDKVARESSVMSKNSDNSEDTLLDSYTSLDDVTSFREGIRKIESIVDSASSYPENRSYGAAGIDRRGYESDGRADEKNVKNRLDENSRDDSSDSSEDPSECSQLLDKRPRSSKSSSRNRTIKDEPNLMANEYRASTDYIDSIRRSSENVFARTEALARQKTSFKVMKPRT